MLLRSTIVLLLALLAALPMIAHYVTYRFYDAEQDRWKW